MKARWGFIVLAIVSFSALIEALLQPALAHYQLFVAAARTLWSGQNPYGSDLGARIGYFFYSPTSALFFFGPFSILPEKLGVIAFTSLSWALFVYGAIRLTRALFESREESAKFESGPLQWFWFVAAPQVFSAILATKLELFMTGAAFLATAWILESRKRLLSAVVFALILNFKFQPLPAVALIALSLFLTVRDWKWTLSCAAALAFWYAIPFLFVDAHVLLASHRVWSASFSGFVHEAWLTFENVFFVMNGVFGIHLSYVAGQLISVAAGAFFAAFLFLWVARRSRTGLPAAALPGALLLSLALGAAFITLFSPLGQNNALVLYTPMLLAILYFLHLSGEFSGAWKGALLGLWFVMAFAYSDISPNAVEGFLRKIAVKQLLCLALGVAVCSISWRSRSALPKS